MHKSVRVKNPDAITLRDCFGATVLSTVNGLCTVFMSSMFMQYMTDYAGLGAMGATLATSLLLFARIFDAVDDPIQGFLMDRGKRTKIGKYKPFFLLSILLTGIGCVCLYSFPSELASKPVLVVVWVIVFYFLFDVGTSFYKDNLLFRTMTNDPNERSKLVIGPRVWTMILGVVTSAFTAVLVAVNEHVGNYHDSFAILITAIVGAAMVLSLIGWFLVKEKHSVQEEEAEPVKFKDFFLLFKENKPMVVYYLKGIFSGFIWSLIFATPAYYIKWGFCTDLTTGVTNMEQYGVLNGISSMMMLIPLLVGAVIGRPLLKLFKNNPIKMTCFLLVVQSVGGVVLFITQMAGLLANVPALFFVTLFIMAVGVGTDFVPQSMVEMEIMDYNIYKTGKDRSALTMVAGGFIVKAQAALSAAIIGAVLMSIGYNVDPVTSEYMGELSQIPTMLNWFIVIMGLVPAILGVLSALTRSRTMSAEKSGNAWITAMPGKDHSSAIWRRYSNGVRPYSRRNTL
jgi:Na+/melibiose symporter-like transporter